MNIITLKNVNKFYGKVHAVKDLNLSIEAGEFFSLLGPSGCGKSTTMRIIAGLEKITSGELYLRGKLANDIPTQQRNLAMVFEDYALYPHLSVFENIAFPLKVRKLSLPEVKKKVTETTRILGIDHLLNRGIKGMGDGEKQRIGIARAIVTNADIIIMDEPISHLDLEARVRMRTDLKKMQIELGATFVYVTHDQAEAIAMADKVAVMKTSELQQVATPYKLYAHPVNEFVAGFVGEPPISFIDCTLEGEKGALYLNVYDIGQIKISSDVREKLEKKIQTLPSDVRIGIRPSDIEIFHEKRNDSIPAKLIDIEKRPDTIVITTKVGEAWVRIQPKNSFEGKIGSMFWLDIKKHKLSVFDKNTGENLIEY